MSPQQDTTAPAPFDDPLKSDIVIHTSDGINFYLYKLLLSLSSPVFEDMFTLAEPSLSDEQSSRAEAELPYIEISEDSETLRILLSFIDPRTESMSSLSFIQYLDVMTATDKYQMDMVQKRLPNLRYCYVEEPIESYLKAAELAESHEWAHAGAEAAAEASLRLSFESIIFTKIKSSQAIHLCRLIRYHKLCNNEAAEALRTASFPSIRSGSLLLDYPEDKCGKASHYVPDDFTVVKPVEAPPSSTEPRYIVQYRWILSSVIKTMGAPKSIFTLGRDLKPSLLPQLSQCLRNKLASHPGKFSALHAMFEDEIRKGISKVTKPALQS